MNRVKWAQEREAARVRFHSWWDSPAVLAIAERIHPRAAHASWFENFPWNRLPGVELPAHDKPPVTDPEAMRELDPTAVQAAIGDGSYGGPYAVPDEDALRVWEAGVADVRALTETL